MPSDDFTTPPSLREGKERYEAKTDELAKLFEAAKDGDSYDYSRIKSLGGSPSEPHEVAAHVQNLNAEVADLGQWVKDQRESSRQHEAMKKVQADRTEPVWSPPQPEGGSGKWRKGFGDFFVESKAFEAYKGGGSHVSTMDIDAHGLKTLMTTSAGWAPENLRLDDAVLSAQRPIAVADQIPFFSTEQSAVVYMLESTLTNNAAEAAEGAAFGEAALALTQTTSTVRKIAVALPVTDEQLSDVGGIRDYINQRLSYMIRARLDSQILVGNGTAPNLEGLNNVTGINTTAKGSDPTPDAIYKSIRKCRAVGFANPTAVFIHPSDWEAIRLLRDTSGNYIWGPPSSVAPISIFGIPVTETTAATENTISLGDLQGYSGLFVRRGVDIETGWTGTQFSEGEVTIRATMRVAMVWFRASALATVTGV